MPPPREEQVVQIEASLRRWFFPLVPKVVVPGRENWQEEQHDTGRLFHALANRVLPRLALQRQPAPPLANPNLVPPPRVAAPAASAGQPSGHVP